ncbi:hypothetical protein H0H81_008030 [Sphagnurus paluster]|uniref:Uncharacterized protein n=1 Tax=Sphagnurus paluster TaxID=117069 RepID=A0A9P7FSF4_9AGAR|nr:hypothetical protein H0H81_008030 [Sphagnurus paluster]
MSSLLLLKHHEVHTIQDDMESFVLLLLYYGLRYLQHTGAFGSSLSIIEHIFDYEGKDENGGTIGGKTKETMFTKANYLGNNFQFHSTPFDNLIKSAFQAVGQWIEAENLKTQSQVSQGSTYFERLVNASARPASVPPPLSSLTLRDHTFMSSLFHLALSDTRWPTDDAANDSKFQEERQQRKEKKRGKRRRDRENSGSPVRKNSRSSTSKSLLAQTWHEYTTRKTARLSTMQVGEGSVRRSAPN